MTTDTKLSTKDCTPELHQEYGGACYHCCGTCNYDRHICHFCGEHLRHGGTDWNSEVKHACYAKCECGHIGHEHFSESCRGGDTDFLSTDCVCTEFRPKEQTA